MKKTSTKQEVLEEARDQEISLTDRQSNAIAEMVDADLEVTGGIDMKSKKARIAAYLGIVALSATVVAALGAAGKYAYDKRNATRDDDAVDPAAALTANPAANPAAKPADPVVSFSAGHAIF